MILDILKRIAVFVEKKQDSIFTYPLNKQIQYLKSFPEPKDCIDRSFFQYKCQMKLYGFPLYFLLNVAALPLSFFLIFRLKKRLDIQTDKKSECVFFDAGKPSSIIPDSLLKRYQSLVKADYNKQILDDSDIDFILNILKKHPFSWMFILKIIIKVSQYSYNIHIFKARAIICCDEFSFTSSVMTQYCRNKKIKLINVMHGEKLYYIRDSFCSYDEYYVWDKYYIDLLRKLRFEENQFRVEVPSSLFFNKKSKKKEIDFTYYLASESEEVLSKIHENLIKLQKQGKIIALRPHPRYSDLKLVSKIFNEFEIEDYNLISLEESILRTKGAISLYSTCLNQAYHNNVEIVIDDLSDIKKYLQLKELSYVLLNYKHKKMSELLK